MVCVGSDAGVVLRPNSSLAGVAGLLGFASGGSGSGSMLPLVLRGGKVYCEQREGEHKCDAPRKAADPCFQVRYFHIRR
jgi:hypothetical protein